VHQGNATSASPTILFGRIDSRFALRCEAALAVLFELLDNATGRIASRAQMSDPKNLTSKRSMTLRGPAGNHLAIHAIPNIRARKRLAMPARRAKSVSMWIGL